MDRSERERLEKLYEREAKNVYKFLYHLCGNRELSEDLTMDTFVQAGKSLAGFRGECKESVWLCQIAKNLWYRERKKMGRTEPFPENYEQISADRSVEEEVLASLGRLEWFQRMQGLEPSTREVMYLRLYGDLSFKEIGEVLGRTETWARVTFYRGKQKMKGAYGNGKD